MIESSLLVALTLLSIVLGLLALEKHSLFSRVFHYLPIAFWCYFIPVLLASFGVLPNESGVYKFLTTYGLAACLLLLLLSVNLPAILRLGPTALGTMAIGIFSIGTGAVVSYALFHGFFPSETWKGVGALSASWTGGSANMLAVKEGLQVPDAIFAPMVIVDSVVTYSWMALLITLVPFQDRWDRWVKADRTALHDVIQRLALTRRPTPGVDLSPEGRGVSDAPLPSGERSSPDVWRGVRAAVWLIPLALGAGALCIAAGRLLPTGSVISANGWAFLIAIAVGLGLSFTPASRLENVGASRFGYFFLYLLLAAIGSKARLQDILQAPLLLAMAVLWVSIHATLMALYGWWRKIPLFFLVAASQANIGGTASAPIVAGLYQPRLAPVGLLLAISANVIGTYVGMAIAFLCRLFV